MPTPSRYALLKSRNQCPGCANPPKSGFTYCETCLQNWRDKALKPICVDCGAAVTVRRGPRKRCDECIGKRNRSLTKAWVARQPPEYQERKRLEAVERSRARRLNRREREYENNLKRKYGISLEDFLALYEKQGKACAVCRIELPNILTRTEVRRNVHVDHCHKSSTVRGILCNRCNMGLGMFRDSPTTLRAAADYLSTEIIL